MSLHQCHELTEEAITVYDQQVLEKITTEFKFGKYLGAGRIGHVFMLHLGPEMLAMKVMPCNAASEQEIRTSCLLNSLKDETGIFVYTFGWLSCSEFPKHLLEFIQPEKQPSSDLQHIYMFSGYVLFAWNDADFRYSDTDYRIFFFLLLHGIYIGRKNLQFFHHDIYDGNIMLHSLPANEKIHVATSTMQYEVLNARYAPKLIDYGESNARPISTNNKNKYKVSDLRMLSDEFFRMMGAQKNIEARRAFLKLINSSEFKIASEKDASEYIGIGDLLNHEYFNIPEIKRIEKQRMPLERCLSCTTPANVAYQNTGLNFCSTTCAKKSEKIISFLF